MKLIATNIGVDAGLILICDYNYLKKAKANLTELKSLGKTLKCDSGKYKINWSIPNTWNGSIKGTKHLTVTGNKIVVIDPCYVLQCGNQERWMKWLKDNGYGDSENKGMSVEDAFCIDKMGGDGEYTVVLDLERVK
jgi:hypothetical protein